MFKRIAALIRIFFCKPVTQTTVDENDISALSLRDDVAVKVKMNDGTHRLGRYRGVAPDGSFAVVLEGEENLLYAFKSVELV